MSDPLLEQARKIAGPLCFSAGCQDEGCWDCGLVRAIDDALRATVRECAKIVDGYKDKWPKGPEDIAAALLKRFGLELPDAP